MSEPLKMIDIQNVSFGYNSKQNKVLDNLSLNITKGSFTAVIGPNGAGKSTLLKLLNSSLHLKKGKIFIDGKNLKSYSISQLATKIATVSQETLPAFGFTALETVLFAGTFSRSGTFESQADIDIALQAMRETETQQFSNRPIDQLSGGERQRVFIARAIAQRTPLLLLDEPGSFLDLKHQISIFDLMRKMQQEKDKTIIAITHDINLAVQYCDHTLVLAPDKGNFFGKTEEILTAELIEEVFGVNGVSFTNNSKTFFMPISRKTNSSQ